MWAELLTAVGLLLVLEGIMPFLNPARVRRLMRQLSETEDQTLRVIGLVSMLAGLALLYFFRP